MSFFAVVLWTSAGRPIFVEAWQPPQRPSWVTTTTSFRIPTTTTLATKTHRNAVDNDDDDEGDEGILNSFQEQLSSGRRRSLTIMMGSLLLASASRTTPVQAIFDGGIGGLGKTRPETGVVFVDDDIPAQQTAAGLVSAELLVDPSAGTVALVSFQAPWPLLSTSTGLEARDLATSDAAFCQVVPWSLLPSPFTQQSTPKEAAKALQTALEASVLAPQGKFGMYGAPSSIKVKPVPDDPTLFVLSFTTLTPGMRESDRKYYVSIPPLPTTTTTTTTSNTNNKAPLVMLLVGSTANALQVNKPLCCKWPNHGKSWRPRKRP